MADIVNLTGRKILLVGADEYQRAFDERNEALDLLGDLVATVFNDASEEEKLSLRKGENQYWKRAAERCGWGELVCDGEEKFWIE